MLFWLDDSQGGGDSIELAIWFHDIIYDPKKNDNEAQSAEYFSRHLGSLIEKNLASEVVRLIIATDPRTARTSKADEDLLSDIDLSILSSSSKDYNIYCAAVRSEYSFVSNSDFSTGRRAILEQFLQEPIFATTLFADREQQARINIQQEISSLTASS